MARSTTRWLVGDAICGALALAAGFLFYGSAFAGVVPERSGPTATTSSATAGTAQGDRRPVTPTEPLLAPRDPLPQEPCVLRLQVREDGQPASGRVSWLQSRRSSDLTLGLAFPSLPGMRDDPAVEHCELAGGAARLDLRAGEWLGLRLCSSTGATAFERVPPYTGSAERTIELRRPPAIHVQVLGADWWTPRPHATFSVLGGDLRTGKIEPIGTRTCDETGYAAVRDIPAGRVVLTAAGARPEDGPPFACPLIWNGFDADVCALLVEPPVRHELSLSVLVDDCERMPIRPKLYLARVDAAREHLIPQQGMLHDGRQDLLFEVPEGIYEVGVLPQGELLVTGGRRVEVGAGVAVASVALAACRDRTHVHLRGPRKTDCPLRVGIEAANGLRTDDPDTLFAGLFHWHRTEAALPSFPEPAIVTCLGRQTAFVSRPTRIAGTDVEVKLLPACCLEVHWFGATPALADTPVLVVTSAGGESVRAFEHKLVAGAGARRPAWAARIVVELGDLELKGMVGERVCWERTCAAGKRQLLVRIEDP